VVKTRENFTGVCFLKEKRGVSILKYSQSILHNKDIPSK
jgi:hypothetical protein